MPLETRIRYIGPFWVGVLADVALGRQDPDQPFAPVGFKEDARSAGDGPGSHHPCGVGRSSQSN